jgi:hypothetical protein
MTTLRSRNASPENNKTRQNYLAGPEVERFVDRSEVRFRIT